MTDIANLRGCGTALVTPFREDQSIDEDALGRFVEFQISEGIDFLVPCGTTGESVTLSEDEQRRVVEIVVNTARKRVPVIAGAGGNNTAKVIKMAREFERLGADGLLSVAPYYNKPTQEGLYQHFRAIAESTALPVILYNVPHRTSVNITADTAVRLSEIPNVAGVKEASGDLSQIAEIAARARAGFKVVSGDDALTLPVIAVGGVGLISVASNEVPARMTALTKAALDNNWDEARRLNGELMALVKANFLEASPAPAKAALAMMGKMKEVCRLPIVPVTAATRERLRSVLVDLKLV
jgi:4-hydroxy-tetrahydrodipicolinate synthase